MAFNLGDLIIDRIVEGVAEIASGNDQGKLLYTLTNLSEATIDITADSVDAVDGVGAVIKTFYRGKQGEFTATNSTISLPIIGAMSGKVDSAVKYASRDASITMPMIITPKTKSGIAMPGVTGEDLPTSLRVNGVFNNGTLGDPIAIDKLALTGPAQGSTWSTLTITDTAYPAYIIKYDRVVMDNGVKIINDAEDFPKTIKLTLKVLICDPCDQSAVKAAYVVFPSFQPSPELSIQFATDATIDYKGKLQTSYCGTSKVEFLVA